MRAELIAVGTELLLSGRRDSNGDWLASRLAERGVEISRRTIAPDAEHEVAELVTAARSRVQLVVVTGGLGPTKDDLTREAIARSLGVPLLVDPAIRARIHDAYRTRGYPAAGPADAQARIPLGCEPIDNPVGSAPGLLFPGPPAWVVSLPGVPAEMRAMFDLALQRLDDALPAAAVPRVRLLLGGIPESEADERLRDLIGPSSSATVTILAGEGGVELLIVGSPGDPRAAAADVARLEAEIRRRLGSAIVGDGETTLASAVGALLCERKGSLAVAESCTGGLLGARITDVPGASEWFLGGFLVYSDALKRELLGISDDLLRRHGAVSEPAGAAMAEGARARTGATHALGITGIAGPTGGTDAKPVGLVYVSLAAPGGTRVKEVRLKGDRATVRARSVAIALELLRRALIGEGR